MARRHKKHEEHINHEAWAIPYGDLLTLLLAFFVVMYAMSSINEGKYRVLSDSLFAAFRGVPRTMQPIQVGEKQVGSGADIETTLVEQAMLEGQPRSLFTPVPVRQEIPRIVPTRSSALQTRAAALGRLADEIERAMADLVAEKLIAVRRNQLWIEVEIRTDILFPSGSAILTPHAVDVIRRLAAVLRPFPNPIRVEGHTDNVPINTPIFPSNWELSAGRAANVVHVFAREGIEPARLAVIGLGEYHPIATNDTPEGRNANRRVVIVILSTEGGRAGDSPTLAEPQSSAEDAPQPPVAGVESAAPVAGTLSAP